MGLIKEFRDFAVKGNVVDMAVGIIIGAAFGTIVKSLVDGVLMPPIGLLIGNVNFSQLFMDLSGENHATLAEAVAAGVPIIKYGAFIQSVIDFTIVALAVFVMVKAINAAKRKEEIKPSVTAPTPEDILLLREIRDALKK
jgi:large conductance mechanosensitive channel